VLVQKVNTLKQNTDSLTAFEAQKELIPQIKKLGIDIDNLNRKIEASRVRTKAG